MRAGYVARRFVLSVFTLLLITVAVYTAIRLAPGAPTTDDETAPAVGHPAPAQADVSIPIGYARWIASVARLDLGASTTVQPGRSVASMIGEALPFTVTLGCLSFVLTLGLAVPLGVLGAWPGHSMFSRASGWLLYALYALPAFWIALALQNVMAGELRWLPAIGAGPMGGVRTGAGGLIERAPYWILPTLSVSVGSLAFVIRFCRTSLREATHREYTVAARARGASTARVLWTHALANSAVPLISLIGLMLPGIVSGSVLVETIFALPGVGRLFLIAAARRDFSVVMAVSLLTACATLAANLLADLLNHLADPRMRPADGTGGTGGPDARGTAP
ncbi:MAG TPA: ABC transporter permease [Patescibacteria group bacterium]|nr:ABC transporter permease [Patescibacteria group bacterium]